MPLIFGSYLAGSLLSILVPVGLLIAFAVYFYRQARRMPENAPVEAPVSNAVETPAAPGQPSPQA